MQLSITLFSSLSQDSVYSCHTHAFTHTHTHAAVPVPIHGEVYVLYVDTLPEGVWADTLDEVGLQVEVLQLPQATQHPLRQISQLVKAHLEDL